MQRIATAWKGLDTRRQLIVGLSAAAVFVLVLGLARMAATPSLALLYADLESAQAGEVINALEQRGVSYEIRGGSILVETPLRDQLRMTLASEGLPANTVRGYELLDNLSGFGTTSQMFDAAYWRAKEGELARTIVSHPAISSARVHIAQTSSNPFRRDLKPSASVSISASGTPISAQQARGLKYLVASAVAGLSTEDVSVIDGKGNLLGAPAATPAGPMDDRAKTLRERVKRLVEARVGPGNAVVEVDVDTINRTESVRERVVDPQSRVAISVDKKERTDSASGQDAGVTVASNLPDGDAGNGGASSSQTNETRERVNYETSETEREVTIGPGATRRLAVAVLVNGAVRTEADGTELFDPRPQEELDALRDLVAAAVGYDETRGDVITIKSMQFEQTAPAGTAARQPFLAGIGLDVMSLVQALVLGLVVLILGLFVIRPLLLRPAGARASLPPALDAAAAEDRPEALTGEIDTGEINPDSMSLVSIGNGFDDGPELPTGIAGNDGLSGLSTARNDPVERLRSLIGERREETVEILRTWLEGEEENA